MANEVRIKLSADTKSVQDNLKLVDREVRNIEKSLGELGEGSAKLSDNAAPSRAERRGSSSSDSAQREVAKSITGLGGALRDLVRGFDKSARPTTTSSGGSSANAELSKLRQRLDTLQGKYQTQEQTRKALLNKSKGVYDKYGEGSFEALKIDRQVQNVDESMSKLGDQINDLKDQIKQASDGAGGGTAGPGGGGPPNNGGDGTSLKDLAKGLATAAVAISAVKAMAGYVTEGAKHAQGAEYDAYQTYQTSGWFGNDFNKGRSYALNTGSGYGYTTGETMDIQSTYMGMSGVTTQDNLTADTQDVMHSARAYGLDANREMQVAGRFAQYGTYGQGNMSKFTNMLASSIKQAGMTGRESEQLDVLESIEEMLGRTNTLVESEQVTAATGLYSMLASGNQGLKGQRGESLVENLNNSITGGDNQMDVLLGWGTQYTGAAGRWQLEMAKARGISDPNNLKNVFNNFEKFTGMDIDSDYGKLALMKQFGIKPDEVEELLKYKDEIKSGSYSEDFQKYLESMSGTEDENEKYDKGIGSSKVLTQLTHDAEKEGAQDAAGNVWNNITAPFKGLYNSMPEWMQAGTSMVGKGIGTVLGNPITQIWGAKKLWGLGKNLVGKFGGGGAEAAAEGTAAAAETGEAASAAAEATAAAEEATAAAGEATAEVSAAAAETAEAASAVTEGAAAAGETAAAAAETAAAEATGTAAAETAAGVGETAVSGAGLTTAGVVAEGAVTVGSAVLFGQDLLNQKRNADIDKRKKDEREQKQQSNSEKWADMGYDEQSAMDWYQKSHGGKAYDTQEGRKSILKDYNPYEDPKFLAEHGLIGTDKDEQPVLGEGGGIQTPEQKKQQEEWEKANRKERSWGEQAGDWIWNSISSLFGWNSHAVGNDYVPRDNYPAMLHKGEAVLTKDEATDWRKGMFGVGGNQASRLVDASTSLEVTSKRLDTIVQTLEETLLKEDETIDKIGQLGQPTAIGRKTFGNTNYATSGTTGVNNTPSNSADSGGNTYVNSKSESVSGSIGGLGGMVGSIFSSIGKLFGSHATGLGRVPYNGYLAELHKDEAVLPAAAADRWRSDQGGTFHYSEDILGGSTNTLNLKIDVSGNIEGMTDANQDEIIRAVVAKISSSSNLDMMNFLGNNTVRTAH